MASNTVVNTNVLALNANRNLGKVATQQSKASQKLSSGLKINSAADDAAGLAISETMRSQIRGLDMAAKNSQDGISLIQTAEGGMEELGNMVQRMRELTVQASNDTNAGSDRSKIGKEIEQLKSEITSMSSRVEFNGKTLLDGSISSINLQVGANKDQMINVTLEEVSLSALSLTSITITSTSTATEISGMIETVGSALDKINESRANLGAYQNRLEYTINSLNISSENLSASESRIRDTDMAKEMMNLTKANVLQQAATSMLAQANQAPQGVLQLLQ